MLVHGPYPIGEERVLREARAAQAHGWEVDIVALRKPSEPRRETLDGCRVFRLPLTTLPRTALQVPLEYFGFFMLATAWLLRSLIRPYDVVQVHNPPDFLLAAGLIPGSGEPASSSTCTTLPRSSSIFTSSGRRPWFDAR